MSQGGCCDSVPLPEVTFSTFIISLASSVLVGLGEVPDPASGNCEKDMLLARHNIDVLEMLRQRHWDALSHRNLHFWKACFASSGSNTSSSVIASVEQRAKYRGQHIKQRNNNERD